MDNAVLSDRSLGLLKILGVILHSDPKFSNHIADEISSVKADFMIRSALYWAPEKARMIAYKSLCLPRVEYVSCTWDSFTNKEIKELEMAESQGIRMICGLNGKERSLKPKRDFNLNSWAQKTLA